jgi:hypothetical protein
MFQVGLGQTQCRSSIAEDRDRPTVPELISRISIQSSSWALIPPFDKFTSDRSQSLRAQPPEHDVKGRTVCSGPYLYSSLRLMGRRLMPCLMWIYCNSYSHDALFCLQADRLSTAIAVSWAIALTGRGFKICLQAGAASATASGVCH